MIPCFSRWMWCFNVEYPRTLEQRLPKDVSPAEMHSRNDDEVSTRPYRFAQISIRMKRIASRDGAKNSFPTLIKRGVLARILLASLPLFFAPYVSLSYKFRIIPFETPSQDKSGRVVGKGRLSPFVPTYDTSHLIDRITTFFHASIV